MIMRLWPTFLAHSVCLLPDKYIRNIHIRNRLRFHKRFVFRLIVLFSGWQEDSGH